MITHKDLEGIIPAVIVPMREDYSIDYPAYQAYLEWVIAQGASGLAVNVDTGEGPYMTAEERSEVIRVTKMVSAGRCFVVAGIGGPSTSFAMNNAREAREAGADALLVFPTGAFINTPLTPPRDGGLSQEHCRCIGTAVDSIQPTDPIFGGVNYQPEPLAAALELPEVIGLKNGLL